MKYLAMINFLICLVLLSARESFANTTPTKMTSSTKTSTQLEGRYEKPATPAPSSPKPTLPPPVKPISQVPQHADYLHPGILVNLNDKWEGSDHLLNLAGNIGVYVKVIKPEEEALEINEQQLQKSVEAIFNDANIKPLTLAAVGKPPLPAFEIEIFVYPIERGYTAFCGGRLFESVCLERFKMDENMAFQAITWEKQSLIVSPKAKFSEQVTKTVHEIAETFVSRFQAYEKLKKSASY